MKKQISKTEKILKHLKKYKRITSWEAITLYHVTRLSGVIYRFRRDLGMNIKTEMVYKEGINYAVYRLKK